MSETANIPTLELLEYQIRNKQGYLLHVVHSARPLSQLELDYFLGLIEVGMRIGTSDELREAKAENQALKEQIFLLESERMIRGYGYGGTPKDLNELMVLYHEFLGSPVALTILLEAQKEKKRRERRERGFWWNI